MWRRYRPEIAPDFIEGNSYTSHELDLIAEQILREDARKEICRSCDEEGKHTGETIIKEQFSSQGEPLIDEEGKHLKLAFPQYSCKNNHLWYKGEGRVKGTRGENPILFEEHIISRKRREIHTCVDKETECLTLEHGWTSYDQLQEGDSILAFDKDTYTTRWEPVQKVNIYEHDGEMISWEGRCFSALTTRNHKWPLDYYDIRYPAPYKGVYVRDSSAMGGARKSFILGAPHEWPDDPTYDDDFVRLQAWNLTESYQFILSGTGVDPIVAVCGRERTPSMEFYSSLTEYQMAEFIRILIAGDGTKGTSTFNQYKRVHMDNASIAFVLGGYQVSEWKKGTETRSCSVRGLKYEENSRINKWVHRTKKEIIQYNNIVWCPTVPSSFWLARRHGSTYMTGNSEGTPDPNIVSGLYWRSHENGRKIATPDERRAGSSYYK